MPVSMAMLLVVGGQRERLRGSRYRITCCYWCLCALCCVLMGCISDEYMTGHSKNKQLFACQAWANRIVAELGSKLM